jgi:hypothetical protein
MANEPPKTPFDSWHQQRCHPNAPAGGGGPGCFTTAGPLGASGLGWDSLPYPNSPAGRHLTPQEIRDPPLPERVQSVVNAYSRALRLAPEAVYRETGYQLGQVIDSLLPSLLQMLAVLGISAMVGASAGAAIGFFLGGVGAAPGAAVGATLGLETGTAVLTWMGLGFLVVAIGQGMGESTGVLRRGIRQAWHAPEHHFPHFETDRAAEDLARAVGILFRLILQGLLAYVLKNGAVSASRAVLSTGQSIAKGGTRAAADETLAEISALLRSSKLPDGFVVWLERNWEDLQRNLKLASNKTGPAASSQASSSAATPSELKAIKERQGSENGAGNSGNENQPVVERTAHDKMTGKDGSSVPNTFKYSDGIAYRADLKHHLANFDGTSKTKVLGTHNANNFYDLQNTHQLKIVGETEIGNGIKQVEYQLPAFHPQNQSVITHYKKTEVKTVYDPAVYSDEVMLNHAQKAASRGYAQGLKDYLETGNRFYNSSFEGIDFRVALNKDEYGNVYVDNVHPR